MARAGPALVVLIAALTSCTGSSPSTPSAAPSPPAAAVTVSDRAITLSCADAGSGSLDARSGSALEVGRLTFEGLAAELDDVPRATDVGLRLPTALTNWRFRKAPVYVPAGTAPVRLQIRRPAAGALAWVPADLWTSGANPDLTRWATTALTFESCPGRTATYFGGLLAPTTDTCLHLDARSDHAQVDSLTTRLNGADCPA